MSQIKIAIGEKFVTAFLQGGFFDFQKSGVGVHSHNFAEIHLVLNGEINFFIEDESISLCRNQAIIIPKMQKHFFSLKTEKAESIAFQVDVACEDVLVSNVSDNLLYLFAEETKKTEKTADFSVLSGLISALCNKIIKMKYPGSVGGNTDFLIKEFFSHNYMNDVNVSDLAKLLHFSPRHTERIVKTVTGMTFKENIIFERKIAADYLKNRLNLSKQQIAEQLGYKTYAGYYKMIGKNSTV